MTEGWGAPGEQDLLEVWWYGQNSTAAFFTMQTLPGGPVLLSLCCVCEILMCPKSFWESPCGIRAVGAKFLSTQGGRRCLFSLPSIFINIFHRTHLGSLVISYMLHGGRRPFPFTPHLSFESAHRMLRCTSMHFDAFDTAVGSGLIP